MFEVLFFSLFFLLVYLFYPQKSVYAKISLGHTSRKYHVKVLKRQIDKMIGLLNHSELGEHSGVVLKNCKKIHTRNMSFAIDAIGVDQSDMVVEWVENLEPGRIHKFSKRVKNVVELRAGTVQRHSIQPRTLLRFEN